MPVGYLIGRVDTSLVLSSFVSITGGPAGDGCACIDALVARLARLYEVQGPDALRAPVVQFSKDELDGGLGIPSQYHGARAWRVFMRYVAQLSVFEVLYTHTSTISGWDVHGMRIFMGCLFLVDVFYMILFMENMDTMSSLIKRGDLDLYLVKPIDAQFMVSCRKGRGSLRQISHLS